MASFHEQDIDGGQVVPVRDSQRSLLVIVLVLLAIPTMGASCIPLWILADRECGRARVAGAQPETDVRLLRDVGMAGTIVFATCFGLMMLYLLYFARAGEGDLR